MVLREAFAEAVTIKGKGDCPSIASTQDIAVRRPKAVR